MTSIKVRLYTYRETRSGTYPLVFQILHRRKKRVIYSSYRVHKECFDQEQGRVVSRRRRRVTNADEINAYIRDKVRELRKLVQLLEERERDYSVSDITDLYRSYENDSLVTVYIDKQIARLRQEGRMGTLSAYQSALGRLKKFMNGKAGELYFSDITPGWLNRFIENLQEEGLKENTVNFYCRILRAVYNRACNEGVTGTDDNSPFRRVAFGCVKTVKRAVDGETIKKIVRAQVGDDAQLELARDLFLFSFYSRGMAFVDMACLKQENIVDGAIYYTRRKTGQPLRVKMVPQLQEIVNKYRGQEEYILPILKHGDKLLYKHYRNELRKFNNRLKKLSSLLSLKRPLTSYVARHSWATQARKSGAPVSVISESLGHASEKVTYTYLAALDPIKVDSVNERISRLYL